MVFKKSTSCIGGSNTKGNYTNKLKAPKYFEKKVCAPTYCHKCRYRGACSTYNKHVEKGGM